MKNLKLFLVAGLLTVSAPAFAQFANTGNNSGSKRSSSSASASVTEKTYSRIELSYNPTNVTFDFDDEDLEMTGISLGYVKGFSISKNYPIYVEAGLRLTYAWNKEDGGDFYDGYYEGEYYTVNDEWENKTTYLGLTIPVNIAYRFSIPNSQVTVSPFIGVTFKGNIIGETKYEETLTVALPDYNVSESESNDSKTNWFDDEDDEKEPGWGAKRFQIGWNIGANVSYNQFNVGFSYGSDFSELAKKTKTNNWAISVGYNF